MRFVAVKTVEQQNLQTVEQRVKSHAALSNQRCRVLMEYGLVLVQGLGQGCQALPLLLVDTQNG